MASPRQAFNGDDYAIPGSINSFDEIVGISFSNNTPVMHAFRWKDGAYTVLVAGSTLRRRLHQ